MTSELEPIKMVEERVYIAGPFFNEVQLQLIKAIEDRLAHFGVRFFSPRATGVLMEMDPEGKAAALEGVYLKNVEAMDLCSAMVAVIDDRDAGTIFEMGYFTALARSHPEQDRTLVSLTNQDFGMNVMMRQSVDAHLRGLDRLGECMIAATCGQLDGKSFMEERGDTW